MFPSYGQPQYARNVASYRNVVLFCFFNNGRKSCETFLNATINIFCEKRSEAAAKMATSLCIDLHGQVQSLSCSALIHCNEYRPIRFIVRMTSSEEGHLLAPHLGDTNYLLQCVYNDQ